jgi:hypothetical protein
MDSPGLAAALNTYVRLKYDPKLTEAIEYCISIISHYNGCGASHFVLFAALINLPKISACFVTSHLAPLHTFNAVYDR